MTRKLIIKKPPCIPVENFKNPSTYDAWNEGPASRYIRLNYLNSWDDDFVPIKCETNDCSCNEIAYLSTDPRLISSSHNGDKLALDTIPRNGKIQALSRPIGQFNCGPYGSNGDVCDEPEPADIESYKPVYNTYSDIRGGDISYYFGQDLATPFIPQLFVQNAQTFQPSPLRRPPIIKEHYIDPMDSYKPHYCREPVYSQNCLNWIKDSQYHREDLMSKQLWNRNQNNYQVDIVTN